MPNDFNLPPPESSKAPAISIIIPMYNVEKYIGECLESILAQTFLDFEAIVIDDCSTDNGFEIVKSYVEKFSGRLKLAKMKNNSGFASKPRNVGLQLASGEYIFFVDSDDFIMPNALETLYTAIKKYDADVVYYSSNYDIRQPNDIYLHRDGFGVELLKEGLEDKPDLTVNNPDKILHEFLLINDGNLTCTWTKLIRRDLLLANKIFFPNVSLGEDFIWCINVYCHAKKFLRIPTPLYFYRRYDINTLSHTQKSPAEEISRWFREFAGFMKFLKELEDQTEVLARTPAYCLEASKRQFLWCLSRIREEMAKLSSQEIYEILRHEFSDNVSGLMVPFFFNLIDSQKNDLAQMRRDFSIFTARADIQLIPKMGAGDFFILSVSDEKATVLKPAWLQKKGVGYQIQSYAGNLEFITKATADGQLRLNLLGVDVRDPADNSKRIPRWIDYTKLTINGEPIFNNTIAAWHDKPYTYTFDVKADDEITIQLKWLPHKNASLSSNVNKLRETIELPAATDNAPAVSIIIPLYNAEKFIGEALESILVQTFQNFEVIVVDDCSTDNSCAVVESYIPKFNGRLSLYHMSKNSGCAPAPRNNGFLAARGEYAFFMDSDDTFTPTALEEMYTLAKNYNADVVYCEKYYMSTGVGDEYVKNIRLADEKMQQPPFVDKPTFISDNLADRLDDLFKERFWVTPWQRLVSRRLLVENEITFPEIIGSDDAVWCFLVLCCAKKFLRVPNACYVRRMYNESFTQSSKKSPNKHIRQWMDITIRGLKFVNNFMDKFKFFRENLNYRYKVLSMFATTPSFNMVAPISSKLKSEEVYNIFMTEFTKDTGENNVLVAFLCTLILDYIKAKGLLTKSPRQTKPKKLLPQNVQTDATLETKVKSFKAKIDDFLSSQKTLPPLGSAFPAISVVIPMYNMESYVAECLNSLLIQTFQDFEVIIVDDCSTDNSCAIVESYVEKFSGRLKLMHTKENSGGGGYVPRNIGLNFSRGEYVFFMDPDDFTLENTLETLYNAAREYDTDVVYTSAHYRFEEPNEYRELSDGYGKELHNNGMSDEQTLIVDNPTENLQRLLLKDDFHMPFVKLVRRDFLIENDITFPKIISGGDYVWTIHVYCCSRRFLRLPVPLYFYRKNFKSITEERREPNEQITRCVKAFVLGAKALTDLSNKFDLLNQNPTYLRYAFFPFFKNCLRRTVEARLELSSQEIYDILLKEFADASSYKLFPFLFSVITDHEKEIAAMQEKYGTVFNAFTSRIDIKLVPKASTGDFQIVSISDPKANVQKPGWLQKDGIGYQIQSSLGSMELVLKATSDGQIKLDLMALDVRDPADRSKRVPCWIDYSYLTINEKRIFNKLTPAWHDKPYRYNLDVKAGEEIKLQTEWFPHRKDSSAVVTPQANVKAIANKFLPFITARLDIKLKTTKQGDFQILSLSDDKADIKKPDWLQKGSVGYQIQSHDGSLQLVTKATADGQIVLGLRASDVRDYKDNSKRIPYWIDYTKLVVNDKTIFNKPTPAWHDKAYYYTRDVKANEEIVIQTEWLPHKGDIAATATPTISLPVQGKTVQEYDAEIVNRFKRYFSIRLDLQMITNNHEDFEIVSISDERAEIRKPSWFNRNGVGYVIQSYAGKLDIVFKVIDGGSINIDLKGLFYADPKNKSNHIPYWVDYTKFAVNNKVIFNELTPIWHDKPYNYTMEAKAGKDIKISVEWLPHRSDA